VPTELTFDRHLEGLRSAMVALVRYADRAGPDAAVPTCPGWTVLDLVAHQGMVHRWATGLVRGEWQLDTDVEAFSRDGRDAEDPLEWLRDGVVELVSTLTRAPADLEAPVFLHDAPPPRAFWARRQCHETTIHAVDAMAASLGRAPRAEDVWVDAELAADGIDELLTQFVALSAPYTTRVASGGETMHVHCTDREGEWLVRFTPEGLEVTREHAKGDVAVRGSAEQLYLLLWNRIGREGLEVFGDTSLLDRWREHINV
jgi:uncharacterized protein (TIGR03083 family)